MSLAERIRHHVDDPDVVKPTRESDREWSAKDEAVDRKGRALAQREDRLREARRKRERAAADPRPRDEFLRGPGEGGEATATETKAEQLIAAAKQIEGEVDRLDAERKQHLHAAPELAGDAARRFLPYVEEAAAELGDRTRALGAAVRTGGTRAPAKLYVDAREKRDRLFEMVDVLKALLSRANAQPMQRRAVARELEAAVGDADADMAMGFVLFRTFTWSARRKSPLEGFWKERDVAVDGRTIVDVPSPHVGAGTIGRLDKGQSPWRIDI